MTPPVTLIAAVGRNRAIGARGGLPWRLPSDLKHFRASTMGKPLVMGRRTYESLGRPPASGPQAGPPLPGRHLVVVSRDPALALPDDVARAATPDAALALAADIAARHGAGEIMVGGGAEIYRATIGRADRLLVTEVDLAPEADALFPLIDPALWREASREAGNRAPGDEAGFAIVVYARR